MKAVSGPILLIMVFTLFLSTVGFAGADNSYDRELLVKDEQRSDRVQSVFKELMTAYEDEDAQGFLDLVSDERFRQDYITFTDALYTDFRNYEIHHVDYWIDRIVPDHVKRFLYVRWEKRYEDLDDGRQLTTRGFSRFLFDDVEGDYLLVELAGNNLFGSSLKEWRDEVPPISGQEMISRPNDNPQADDVCDKDHLYLCDVTNCVEYGGYWYDGSCHAEQGEVCDAQHLYLCDASNCESQGGYWYNNSCNSDPQPVCDPQHLYLCDASNCESQGGGYWYDNSCHAEQNEVCDPQHLNLCNASNCENVGGGYWYNNTCNADPQLVCDPQHLYLCDASNCESVGGGYWYDNTCNAAPQLVCDPQHLYLCDVSNCESVGGGYWYYNTCNQEPLPVCDSQHLDLCINLASCRKNGGYWYDSSCHYDPQPQPDLVVEQALLFCSGSASLRYTVRNNGTASSGSCQLEIVIYKDVYYESIPSLSSGQSYTAELSVTSDSCPSGYSADHVVIDYQDVVVESNEYNNERAVQLGN